MITNATEKRVLEFPSVFRPIAIPKPLNEASCSTVEVPNDSLTALGIEANDLLIVDKTMTEIRPDKLYVVSVGGSRYAKRIILIGDRVTLRTPTSGWDDIHCRLDELTVEGTVISFQRTLTD